MLGRVTGPTFHGIARPDQQHGWAAVQLETIVPKDLARRARTRSGSGWGLLIATLLHVAVIVAFVAEMKHSARIMGERDGDPDAITVDVTDGDTLAMLTQLGGQQASAQESPSQSSAQSQLRQTEPPTPEPPRPEPPQPTRQQPPPSAAPKAASQAKAETEALEKDALAMLPLKVPSPGTGGETPKEQQQPAPKKQDQPPPKKQETAKAAPRTAGLDLSAPSSAMNPDMFMGPQSAGMSRPANITRSGENDDFGRGVIRALRATMPLPRGALGRVTVRFLLTERGNLQELRVLESNTDPRLTQEVAFAVRQSSFPIPPMRSTVADRTFVVTYLYR